MSKRGKLISMVPLAALASLLFSCSPVAEAVLSIPRKKAGLTKKSIQVGDHTVVYLEGGKEKGETVVLLHGFAANKDNWPRFAAALRDRYHVIVPDLPGFGESSKRPDDRYDVETQVSRVHDFVKLMGLGKFHLAGNSMGGLIAGLYAAKYPDEVSSLGLFDAGGVADREPSGFVQEVERGFNPLLPETVEDYEKMLAFVFVKQPSIPSFLKKRMAEELVRNKEFNRKVFAELVLLDTLEKAFAGIRARTLVIWGDGDRVFPVSTAAVIGEGIKGSKVVILKDCGHLPMFEKPAETAEHYLAFIAQPAN